MLQFSKTQRYALAILAAFGFIGPNGVFLYFAFLKTEVYDMAMSNPVFLAVAAEALLLMALGACLIQMRRLRPGPLVFIAMSLVGSLAFSVPAYLLLASRRNQS